MIRLTCCLQRRDRLGHGQIGSPRARRPDPEDDGFSSIASTYCFWPSVFGRIVRPGWTRCSSSGRPRAVVRWARNIFDRVLDSVPIERLTCVDDRQQLVDQTPTRAMSALGPLTRISLPRTWMSVREGPLHGAQQLVARTQQGDHRASSGNDHGVLGIARGSAPQTEGAGLVLEGSDMLAPVYGGGVSPAATHCPAAMTCRARGRPSGRPARPC